MNCRVSHTLFTDFPISVSGIWSGIKLWRCPQTRGWVSGILSIRLFICGAFEDARLGEECNDELAACILVLDPRE